jgi:signal transduction histidine kinase
MNALALKSTWQGSIIFGNLLLADIYSSMGNDVLAFHYYRLVVRDAPNIFAGHLIASAQSGMARLFRKEARLDSALIFARRSLSYFQNNKIKVLSWGENSNSYIAEISPLVADIYKDNNQLDSAYKYLSLSVALKDSLYNLDKIRQFQTLTFNETARRQQLEQQRRIAEQQYKTKIKMFVLILGMVAILIIALILFWNIKQKQKANKMLQIQKKEIESALNELKKTQSQLIQSEKMASLGELTAGIAHEIQNPLNFVNNFSEVNTELIEEAYQEFDKGNISEVKAILNDIKENEQKINHHGKRADAIVKGMLQHSRTSSGQKEPTDINALADKYLRLAYHGLRAKDKSFNAEYKTDFDPNLPKINVIPQDIGRVILNLITNAFYAVNEKQHQAPQPSRNEFGTGSEGGIENPQNQYEPTVTVSTKLIIPPEGGMRGALISVKDNGSGIPADIVEKIFQPFFTTKPSGQGTGLGLSLSYDVVKAHGGEIKVDSEQGEGSEFTIILPCNNLK